MSTVPLSADTTPAADREPGHRAGRLDKVPEPVLRALDSLAHPSPAPTALKATIAFVRMHPGARDAWSGNQGPRTVDGRALAGWLGSRPVQAWLRIVPYRRQDEALGDLLSEAEAFLDAEPERLRAAWALHQAAGTWDRLPPSARRLAALLFAVAANHGPRVPLCHRAARSLLRQR